MIIALTALQFHAARAMANPVPLAPPPAAADTSGIAGGPELGKAIANALTDADEKKKSAGTMSDAEIDRLTEHVEKQGHEVDRRKICDAPCLSSMRNQWVDLGKFPFKLKTNPLNSKPLDTPYGETGRSAAQSKVIFGGADGGLRFGDDDSSSPPLPKDVGEYKSKVCLWIMSMAFVLADQTAGDRIDKGAGKVGGTVYLCSWPSAMALCAAINSYATDLIGLQATITSMFENLKEAVQPSVKIDTSELSTFSRAFRDEAKTIAKEARLESNRAAKIDSEIERRVDARVDNLKGSPRRQEKTKDKGKKVRPGKEKASPNGGDLDSESKRSKVPHSIKVGSMMKLDGKEYARKVGGNSDCPKTCPHAACDKDTGICGYDHTNK